jgi:glycosyltransferase involved in cell wall biosynthesis
VIPTGVDTAYLAEVQGEPANPRNLVFIGSMDWLPNVDGVTYFAHDILPRIRHAEPDVTFTIVGRAPTPAVQQLAQIPGVQVTGRVEDIRPYLAEAAVNVVPLRIGGGTRLKIFEAMAAGRASISTRVGAEGLPTQDGRHLLLADDPDAFANAVVTLLRQPSKRQAIETEARALVTRQYDWSVAATHLEQAILDTTTPAPAASGAAVTPISHAQSL